MLLFLLILLLLALPNALLARRKGHSPVLWGLLSILGFFVAYFFIGGSYFALVYKGAMTEEAVTAWVMKQPLTALLMFLMGIGGVLFVRFILERRQQAKKS
ncbi:MAG: hypothetical protein JST06_05570 [Bacteroidetes bacterium]|nr:hypothetical protein [Bacteroidota bacterium]MBS1628595.1 hypothetical protein [Bacteroidota bacterium]